MVVEIASPSGTPLRLFNFSPLILRIQKGETDAYSELYDLLSPSLFGLAIHFSHDRAEAEEVVATVFGYLWEKVLLDSRAEQIDGNQLVAWTVRLTVRLAQLYAPRETRPANGCGVALRNAMLSLLRPGGFSVRTINSCSL